MLKLNCGAVWPSHFPEALIQTKDKVIDIARAHAVCDQSAFTQHFRKRVGMPPKQFRLRHLG